MHSFYLICDPVLVASVVREFEEELSAGKIEKRSFQGIFLRFFCVRSFFSCVPRWIEGEREEMGVLTGSSCVECG